MPFQILSLSGGGYLGYYTISVLVELEKRAGRPLAQCFDLTAGTSIGGVIALCLASRDHGGAHQGRLSGQRHGDLFGSSEVQRHRGHSGRYRAIGLCPASR